MTEKIAIIGLGYVGLPAAVALARHFPHVVGFDINPARIAALRSGIDATGEVDNQVLAKSSLVATDDPSKLADATFYIVTVPTPIDELRRPDLRPLDSACKTVGPHLKKNDIVVFESTVYPGVTEDYCGKLLEKISGLRCGVDFFLGYSPERINPGDKERRFETILKIVSAQNDAALTRVRAVYGAAVTAGLHAAPSIKVAEAAKVIENVQRDVNIALVNELAMIFHRMDIRTKDVLDAAGTKWNFLKFSPGLVGGHCIGVDPYYLASEAERLGYFPHLILAGRRINDGMGAFIAEQAVKNMIAHDVPVKNARIGILGLTFKEDVPDLRNSRVPDIWNALAEYGPRAIIHDPHANGAEAKHEYNLDLTDMAAFRDLDVLMLAVAHADYKKMGVAKLVGMLKPGGLFVDIKSLFAQSDMPDGVRYWSL